MELGLMTNSMTRKVARLIGASSLLAGFAPAALADWEVNLPRTVTKLGQEIYSLHMLIFAICCVIAVVVFGVMIISIFKHRKSRGAQPASFEHNTKAEVIWTIIPILILVGMAIPVADTMIRIDDTRESDLSIKVTAYQWKWRYDYIDEGFGFFSNISDDSNRARQLGSGIDPFTTEHDLRDVDKPMVVPVGAKVRLLITSADVIHSWWVPDIGGKKDAIPGFINEMWFQAEEPGIYRGQCAELCGRDHAFMPVVVEVLTADAYAAWVTENAGEKAVVQEAAADTTVAVAAATDAAPAPATEPAEWSMETAMSDGESLYSTHCVACHQANGQGLPPAFPSLIGSASLTGPVADHIATVVNGRPGTAMVAFGTQLSDQELAAIITYERNAWGTESGDLVAPADIAAAR
jgi:cytochrome c oxidase subunit 2